jgi:hypothetical protein
MIFLPEDNAPHRMRWGILFLLLIDDGLTNGKEIRSFGVHFFLRAKK